MKWLGKVSSEEVAKRCDLRERDTEENKTVGASSYLNKSFNFFNTH